MYLIEKKDNILCLFYLTNKLYVRKVNIVSFMLLFLNKKNKIIQLKLGNSIIDLRLILSLNLFFHIIFLLEEKRQMNLESFPTIICIIPHFLHSKIINTSN